MTPEERVGQVLRNLRHERGLTQSELAEKLGIARRTLQRWEQGEGIVPVTVLPVLSKALAVDARVWLDLPLRGWRNYLL